MMSVRLACRLTNLIRVCLREEELGDVQREFYRMIIEDRQQEERDRKRL